MSKQKKRTAAKWKRYEAEKRKFAGEDCTFREFAPFFP